MSLFNSRLFSFFLSLTAVILCAAVPSWSQNYNLKTEMDIKWETGDIMISAEAFVPDDADNLTTVRFKISEYIDRHLTEIAAASFDDLYLDSLMTMKTFLKENQVGMTKFDSLRFSVNRLSSSFSLDLSSVKNTYKYNIYTDLMPILIDHRKPAPLPAVLDYEPTAAFSGIVIYAADILPMYGEAETGLLKPALFPRIFDENMNLIASARMAEPDFLKKWGFTGYTDTTGLRRYENRIGLYPFFTTAEALFGNNSTDILIGEDAARKILYNEANRRLIREGRILIIYNPGK